MTDGGAQHIKNKCAFSKLLNHKQDLEIYAERHFQATAHGTGLGERNYGNSKTLKAKASLQRSTQNPISTAMDLLEWAKKHLKEIIISFSPKEDNIKIPKKRKTIFTEAITISGTLKYHAFIINENGQPKLKQKLPLQQNMICFLRKSKSLKFREAKNAREKAI